MKTVLVTGGAGFIGSCYVLSRRTAGERVVNLDKLTYSGNIGNLASLDGDAEHIFVRGDIGDALLVRQLLYHYQPDAVINFAAESHVDRSIHDPDAFVRTNVLGTCTLLRGVLEWWKELSEERRNAFRFLHVSTDEVYGTLRPGEPAFTEATPYAPNSPYSASKASSDHFVRAYHETYGLPTLITNCSNNYGPRQFPEKLIPLVILNALSGKPLPIYGTGENIRDWLHVEDHCEAISAVLEKGAPGECYNIGGRSERTNIDVVRSICRILQSLRMQRAVLATGGSVVYRPEAMRYLTSLGPVVFLDVPLPLILERISRKPDRGLAIAPGQTVEDLFREREALYRQWATCRVAAGDIDVSETANAVFDAIAGCGQAL